MYRPLAFAQTLAAAREKCVLLSMTAAGKGDFSSAGWFLNHGRHGRTTGRALLLRRPVYVAVAVMRPLEQHAAQQYHRLCKVICGCRDVMGKCG